MEIKLDQGVRLDLKDALKLIGKLFVRECRLVMNSHLADMPHNDTGLLARSLRVSIKNDTVKITAGVRYATALFMGSDRHGHKIAGKSLFDYVLERIQPEIKRIIEQSAVIATGGDREEIGRRSGGE